LAVISGITAFLEERTSAYVRLRIHDPGGFSASGRNMRSSWAEIAIRVLIGSGTISTLETEKKNVGTYRKRNGSESSVNWRGKQSEMGGGQ
jgi:hypothetical protein